MTITLLDGKLITMLRDWMLNHRRIIYMIFLALAALNGWASYQMFTTYPLFAIPNAAMAALLVLFVIVTWSDD